MSSVPANDEMTAARVILDAFVSPIQAILSDVAMPFGFALELKRRVDQEGDRAVLEPVRMRLTIGL